MKPSILNRAIQEAKKSDFRQRHGCVIFKGNKIISTGFNEIRHCKKLDLKFKRWENSLHSEQRAILYNTHDLKRCSILVIRLNNFNELMYSKPCSVCMGLINQVGIKNIFYSDRNGGIVKWDGHQAVY